MRPPIGNNVRSTVATYSGVFDHLRRLYGRLSDQYSAGDFSYNTGKLRCPVCEGTGTISMDIQLLQDIEMTCEHCDGTRYSNDVDSIMYHGYKFVAKNPHACVWDESHISLDKYLEK